MVMEYVQKNFIMANINKIIQELKGFKMKCKFCGSEDTRDFYISYAAGKKCIERFCAASCNDCNKIFFYMSECELPKIISSKYTIPKEDE